MESTYILKPYMWTKILFVDLNPVCGLKPYMWTKTLYVDLGYLPYQWTWSADRVKLTPMMAFGV